MLLPISAFTINICSNDIPARIQWVANAGYCGEVSMVSAGLYYGQYMSQYDVRALIGSQQEELLLGINDAKAAKAMRLEAECWDFKTQTSTDAFLSWVKQNAEKGYPVVIGVYINQLLMYGSPKAGDGDPDYDHIVPVDGFTSNHDLADASYYGDDVISYTDDGLWRASMEHKFHCSFASFQATREEANGLTAPMYSLSACNPSKRRYNYGIAIKGVKDLKGETLPVRVDTNIDFESPPIADASNQRPPAVPIVLTVTVSQLEPNVRYVLYRYNKLDSVPASDFNEHAADAAEHWDFEIPSGSTYTIAETIQSNDVAVYRAVYRE